MTPGLKSRQDLNAMLAARDAVRDDGRDQVELPAAVWLLLMGAAVGCFAALIYFTRFA